MPSVTCTLEVEGPVATVTLQAKRIGWQALEALTDMPRRVASIHGVRVVCLTGTGDDFCHGADLADAGLAESIRADGGHRLALRGSRMLDAWSDLPLPTIAVLHGRVIGAGVGLALACDLRVAAPDTTVALPEVRRGMHLGWQIIPRLVSTVGLSAARWLTLAGVATPIHGLPGFAQVVDGPVSSARAMADSLAGASPAAVRSIKATLARCVDLDPAADDARRFARSLAGPDFPEAISAFFERRAPRFTDLPVPDPEPADDADR